MAEQEWELFVLAFDVGFEFMRDLADPEPRWADREEALAWLRDEIQNRRGEGDRPAEEFPSALASEGGQKLSGNSDAARPADCPGGNDA